MHSRLVGRTPGRLKKKNCARQSIALWRRPLLRRALPCPSFLHFVVLLWNSEGWGEFPSIQSRRATNLGRSQGTESDWYAILGEAARNLGMLPTIPLLPDHREPGLYLDFLGQTLDFAAFPRKSRHPLAINTMGVKAPSLKQHLLRKNRILS